MLGAFAEKHGITYTLLSDEGSHAIRELGLLNEQVQDHHAHYGIERRDSVVGVPYPGTFLLDEQGIVTDRRFLDSYRERETGVAILEQGFGIRSSEHGPETRASAPGLQLRAYLDSDGYRAYQRLRLTVELAIESGLHVYAEPVPDGYVALAIDVAPIEGLAVGAMEGPTPRPFTVEGLDEHFLVYDGTVQLSMPLTFTEKVGDREVVVTVRYQACSATDCLIPQAVELRLPLSERNNVESDR